MTHSASTLSKQSDRELFAEVLTGETNEQYKARTNPSFAKRMWSRAIRREIEKTPCFLRYLAKCITP